MALAIIGLAVLRSRPAPAPAGAVALAECLTQKGVKFYGAVWCSHCKAQKELFGGAASKLPYIECDNGAGGQTNECTKEGIDSYPTWINASNERLSGEQSFQALADFSGCTLQ